MTAISRRRLASVASSPCTASSTTAFFFCSAAASALSCAHCARIAASSSWACSNARQPRHTPDCVKPDPTRLRSQLGMRAMDSALLRERQPGDGGAPTWDSASRCALAAIASLASNADGSAFTMSTCQRLCNHYNRMQQQCRMLQPLALRSAWRTCARNAATFSDSRCAASLCVCVHACVCVCVRACL
jgi:hypothetical protein